MSRPFTIECKKGKGEVLEVRTLRGKTVVDQKSVYAGQKVSGSVPTTQQLQVRTVSAASGKVKKPWRTIMKATQKPKKASGRKKPAKKKPAKKNPSRPKKKATRKKPAAKKAPKKKVAAKKKRSKTAPKKSRTYKCNICGARVKNLMKHWWSKHPAYARKNLNKAKKARKR